jgi:hypothetical protein
LWCIGNVALTGYKRESPRTVIMAMVSAKYDATNQIVLNLIKKYDKEGLRTLDIVTKPDCMTAGDQDFWMNLAMNEEIFLRHGWHMVKNRSDIEMAFSFAERNVAEKAFFEQGVFYSLLRDTVGIDALRARLSTLLDDHPVRELPSLISEMRHKLDVTTTKLNGRGERRENAQYQRMALIRISQDSHSLWKDASNRHFGNSFFAEVKLAAPMTDEPNIAASRLCSRNSMVISPRT